MTSSVKKIRSGDVRVVGEVSLVKLAWGFALKMTWGLLSPEGKSRLETEGSR